MHKIQRHVREDAEQNLVFFVNGKKVTVERPDPSWTLLWYLRNQLQLTGTKYGCGEGGCGACTVMLSLYLADEDRVKHIAVNACLTPVCSVYGMAVTTVEGIGSVEGGLHPVQERIAKAHGSQCGFCTPGFVMSMYTLLRNKNKLDYKDIETALQGNLCRCTGYRPIVEGFKTFMEGWEKPYMNGDGKCMLGENCCKVKNDEAPKLFEKSKFQPYDPTQEPIFPPELKVSHLQFTNKFLFFQGNETIWIRPNNINELLAIKNEIPESKIVAGNTEIGVEVKFKNMNYPILLSTSHIPEMNVAKVIENGIIIGSSVTLTDLTRFLEEKVQGHACRSKIFKAILEMLHWFAGMQVRNVATLAGNIVTASPISDLNPILMACNAKLHVKGDGNSDQDLNIDDKFFTSYRKTSLKANEVVISVEIPFTEDRQYFKAYKQARRKDDDISIVTSAFNVKVDDSDEITDAKLCFGGMGPMTVCAVQSSKVMIGKQWNKSMLNAVFESLVNEFDLDCSAPGGMADYRKALSLSMFFMFYTWVANNLNNNSRKQSKRNEIETYHDDDEMTMIMDVPQSSQYFDVKGDIKLPTDSIGSPLSHVSALKQATGEAVYSDDLPHVQGELYLALIPSMRAHAKIISINARKALATPGVVAFFSAADLNNDCNKLGPILKDEEIFSTHTVTSRACIVGAIVAETESIAKKARELVEVDYEDLEPVIITIEDAIAHDSYFSNSKRILVKGDVNTAFTEADHVVEGSSRSGAQEHFYLESMCAFAIRKEDELEIVASTQAPAELASLISHALRIPNHKIVAKTKRIGGGFGGKETRSAILGVPVAIAAYKLKRPVRAVLDRDEDMQISGYRHPVLIKHKVAFNSGGRILGVKFDVYSNAGNSMDISCSMNERIITHVDNAYFIPNIETTAYLCKTNMPSNTAFRGFGGPQAMLSTENMIRDVANALNKSYEEIVDVNMYKEGQLTHVNQTLTYCTLRRCWEECIESSDYWKRKRDVEEFNKSNRWKKKGLTLVPTKYGISFQTNHLMQGGALLNVYTDGSVLLSIGGIEMGQGLFTKMIQVASRALEIGVEKIHISEMATDKVPNSTPTAASISSDLYGMAVLEGCNTLNERLKPYKEKIPNGKWEDWVVAAYFDRVNLSATGFYCSPLITYNAETNTGHLFEYYTYGVACSEVLVDCLTGDHNVLRTDIVMDIGESLNPAIDIGQIEGAFMQGYGLFTIEELVYSPSGVLLSRGPGAYKIPAISDIPKVFNVSLLKGAPNPRAVYASKAVGEPPLFLAASVFFAIKEAIRSARIDAGVSELFTLEAPATCAKIRMACEDDITKQVLPTIRNCGKVPWSVTL